MKNNKGITTITLIITIIVIILIASITIYTGMDTVNSVRTKNANDATNAIFLALVANESKIPSGGDEGEMLSETDVRDRTLTNEDFEIMDLDYTTENCRVTFDKVTSLTDENTNLITYTFTYIDDRGNVFNDLVYTTYKELAKTNIEVEFDNTKRVNRPILSIDGMTPINSNGDEVKNVYNENWYNYEKNVSKLAMMEFDGNTYAWIPRFAYKIQEFYVGKTFDNIPTTAIDIIFLRDTSDYMSNNEVLQKGYTVHPAFENGLPGFWVMTNPSTYTVNGIVSAIDETNDISNANGDIISHLMKNSEYAATVFLMRYLGNNEITFDGKEYVAAVCDDTLENFDNYSSDYSKVNYISGIKGQALLDTPWDLNADPILPSSAAKYLLRDVTLGGPFYYEASGGVVEANYRIVITK